MSYVDNSRITCKNKVVLNQARIRAINSDQMATTREQSHPTASLRKIRIAGFLILSLLIAVLSAHHFLAAFEPAPGRIWGDAGDGFFNLWILRHVTEALPGHPFDLADARIFWPDHERSFFWSDNLITFGPVFKLAGFFTNSPLDAFRLTGILLFFIHYAALLFFFYQAFALLRAKWPQTDPVIWFVPLMAGAAQCSAPVLINHFLHIQNFAVAGVFVLLGAMLAWQRNPSAGWTRTIAIAILVLLYSTPYYAIVGVLVAVFWLFGQWSADSSRMITMAKRCGWIGVISVALSLPAVLAYLQAGGREDFSAAAMRSNAITWIDLFLPPTGEFQRWLSSLNADYPSVDYERLAWLGPGLLLAICWVGAIGFMHLKKSGRCWPRKSTSWFVVISLLLLCLKVKDLRPWMAWYGLFFIGSGLIYGICWGARRYRDQPVKSGMMYLLMAVVIFYGIALGPRGYYTKELVNPSLWGFFAVWMPGFDSMRAIGRFAYPGHAALMALVFMLAANYGLRMKPSGRSILVLFGIACLLLQLWDVHAIRPPQQWHDEELVFPDNDERTFFSKLNGSLLALPAHPFHGNTRHMLFFQPFKNIYLMNGYSGHSTPSWNKMMEVETSEGSGCLEQFRLARDAGVDYLAIRTDRVADPLLADSANKKPSPVFKNYRWTVYLVASFYEIAPTTVP